MFSRLPPFWATNGKAWFIQAEAQFRLQKITADRTKHAHVMASLDEHMAAKVADILEASTMAEDKYTTLKQQLLEWFQLLEQECAHRLLEFCCLSDWKPSELLEEILALLQNESLIHCKGNLLAAAAPSGTRSTGKHILCK